MQDALIISHTSINSGEPMTGGIKTPNTPRLTVSNVTFVNFNLSSTSCLRACSHCKVFQGGFQVWFERVKFLGGSEARKTSFQWEHEVDLCMYVPFAVLILCTEVLAHCSIVPIIMGKTIYTEPFVCLLFVVFCFVCLFCLFVCFLFFSLYACTHCQHSNRIRFSSQESPLRNLPQ